MGTWSPPQGGVHHRGGSSRQHLRSSSRLPPLRDDIEVSIGSLDRAVRVWCGRRSHLVPAPPRRCARMPGDLVVVKKKKGRVIFVRQLSVEIAPWTSAWFVGRSGAFSQNSHRARAFPSRVSIAQLGHAGGARVVWLWATPRLVGRGLRFGFLFSNALINAYSI